MSQARQPFPDLVRAFALFGIAVVNVDYFTYAMMGGTVKDVFGTAADRIAWWTVATIFTAKSYTLFSLMFGVGIEQQLRSAAADGAGFAGRHWRRMSGLLVLGLLNAAFLFSGDILVMYALLGGVAFLCRGMSAPRLRHWAIGLYVLQILLAASMLLESFGGEGKDATEQGDDMAGRSAWLARMVAGYASPDFFAVMATRFGEFADFFWWGVLFSGPGVLAFILYGMHAARSGHFEDLGSPRWVRARRVHLPIGLSLAAVGAWLMVRSVDDADPSLFIGLTLITLGSPFSTMGYLGLLAAWMQRPDSPMRASLVRAGGGSLTAYLLQGLLLSLVFSGYGLGMVGKLDAAAYIAIAAAVAVASLVSVGWWRGRYGLGPVETLLRRWVYLGERSRSA